MICISCLDLFFFLTTFLSGFIVHRCWLVTKSYLFHNPMDGNLPSSSIHGILQASILEWIATSFSRGSFWSRDRTCVLCLADGFFTSEPPGKPMKHQRCPKTQKMIRNIGGVSSSLVETPKPFLSWCASLPCFDLCVLAHLLCSLSKTSYLIYNFCLIEKCIFYWRQYICVYIYIYIYIYIYTDGWQ